MSGKRIESEVIVVGREVATGKVLDIHIQSVYILLYVYERERGSRNGCTLQQRLVYLSGGGMNSHYNGNERKSGLLKKFRFRFRFRLKQWICKITKK